MKNAGNGSATTPEEYIAGQPGKTAAGLRALHEAITRAEPELKPHMCSGMLGYGPMRYRTSSGCEGDWFVVGLAARKTGFTLHISGCDADGAYLVEKNAGRLGKVSAGKGCVRFKKVEDLNLPEALSLIRRAAEGLRDGTGFSSVRVTLPGD